LRRELLTTIAKAQPDELLATWPDGRIKLFLTKRVLQFRRDHSDLFQLGTYLPLAGRGTFADCVVSFARQLDQQWVIVIAPRLTSRIGFPPIGEKWQDTAVAIPEGLELAAARNVFTGSEVRFEGRKLNLRDALSALPFAVIASAG
jgi:(1->4)-alpha-D-glucan 1-alpha-D-glucosylmutase